ncbi:Zn-ribbon domain-containing OB-fold protein [Mycobacterium intracellulare]|uniref:Zn-ribbon domain-containing OB-fold protein n=1 Tax=Mycobacterium intracellulare TaxID=1767 RepID=UPI0009F30F9A|nr:OB-fold domain-containing protein [Mycobacterium intracellulare]
MTTEFPYGQTEDAQPFWAAAREGSLIFQRCNDCQFVRWPAAGVCPECLSRSTMWAPVEGVGTLWSNVVYHRAYAPAFKDDIPYPIGLVELDCGVRLVTRLVDLQPDVEAVGSRVAVRFIDIGQHGTVPVFGPA